MQILDSNVALRQVLKQENLDSDEHLKEIERLQTLHSHTIRFIAKRRDQTCAVYAFSLTDEPTYRAVAGIFNVYAGKDFMSWAIGNHLREIADPMEGCFVCYFSGADWKHMGVMAARGRVVSKWGTYPLYEHALAEVSIEYGDQVRFYVRPSAQEALDLFIEFARESGLSDDDVAAARARWRE